MTEIKNLIEKITQSNDQKINDSETIFLKKMKYIISEQVNIMFPVLNNEDKNFINQLSICLCFYIIDNFLDQNEEFIIEQFSQNNFKDSKAVILMLLPFIDDKDDNRRFKIMTDLNMILYSKPGKKYIENKLINNKNIFETLKNEFYFSNFSIGLLNPKENMELIDDQGTKLIYQIIHHNFIGLLETINSIRGKMYVNWINIRPIHENNFIESKIYKNTNSDELSSLISNMKSDNPQGIAETKLKYKGLPIEDFYNVMRNGYYQSVKKVKWLIFNRVNQDKKSKYYIQQLHSILDLKNHISTNYQSFEDLPENDQYKFIKNYNLFFKSIKNDKMNKDIFLQLMIYIVNNYKYKNKLEGDKDLLNKFKFEVDDNMDIIEDTSDEYSKKNKQKIDNITDEDLENMFKNINVYHVWDYLKEAIVYFQSTVYSSYLIEKNKLVEDFFFIKLKSKDSNEYVSSNINLKNMYNIAKLLSHNTNGDWYLLNSSFINLNWKDKQNFISKFFSNSWINIKRNLEIETKKSEPKINLNTRLAEIKSNWGTFNLDFIFIYLIRRGLLSEFKPFFSFTNSKNLPSGYSSKNKHQEDLMKNLFKENKQWNDCYYYLTNTKFGNLDKIRKDDELVKVKEGHYFDYIAKDQAWYKFYAMDWMTQINFFHTYINHRVMFVTGSTGQGKSTQVPKLLMYALKMIDYKENGSVICTQPRIPPTVNNAQRIAFELGVPIIQPSLTINDKVPTDNFYCMYRYQGAQHTTKASDKHLTLKVVTDGTLLEEIKGNPVMKATKPGKTNNATDIIFTEKNLYDVMIVDEAHEHNPNMDMIISLARNACYFNNSLRLIIVSATMDDDEPIYRYYFKLLNDNLIYPIKKPIRYHPFLLNKNFLAQTSYMDRRFHISPPGETTQYTITEYYRDLPENLSPRENSIIAQNESFKVIMEICNKTTEGEILLFSTGEREIKEAVEFLNNNLPGGNIALPYFGTMNPKYKEIIEKIDENIHKIKNQRTNIHLEWGSQFIQDNTVPNGTYKRSIIVATNVAEASVTIPRLAFVVDNGYAKEASYDEKSDSTGLNVEMISEASRVQRKGRVGRIADGTVYYMYRKGARANVKPKYKITQINSGDVFYQLGSRSAFDSIRELRENSVMPIIYDPNFKEFYRYFKNPKKLTKTFGIDFEKSLMYQSGIYNMVNNQFNLIDDNNFNKDEFDESFDNNFSQYFERNILDAEIIENIMTCFLDGYPISLDSILDNKGLFHIIHPKENILIRNPFGKIIEQSTYDYNTGGVKFKKTDSIDVRVYNKSLRMLENKMILLNTSAVDLNDDISKDKNINYRKTLLGMKVMELMGKTMLDYETCMTLINAYGHSKNKDVYENTIMILALLKASNFSITNLVTDLPSFDEIYITNKSDIEIYYIISQEIKSLLKDSKVFTLDKKYYIDFSTKYESIVQKFKNAITKNSVDPPTQLENDWIKLKELKNNNKLNNNTGFLSWLEHSDSINNLIKKDNLKYFGKLIKYCENNFLNENTIFDFLNEYFKLKKNLDTIDKDQDIKDMKDNVFAWVDKYYRNNFISKFSNRSMIDKIILSFMSGYSSNLVIKISNSSKPVLYGTEETLEFATINRYSNEIASAIDPNGIVTMFLAKNFDAGSILTNINIEDLVKVNPLMFNPLQFKDIYMYKNKITNLMILIEFCGEYWEIFKSKISNNWNMEKIVWETNESFKIKKKKKELSYVLADDYDANLNKYIQNLRKKVLTYT